MNAFDLEIVAALEPILCKLEHQEKDVDPQIRYTWAFEAVKLAISSLKQDAPEQPT